MKLHHFRSLVAVADTGSLRSAAAALGVSQPAISQSLRQLERELKTTLLTRTATGTSLTAIGKVLIPRARAIDNEVHRAQEEVKQLIADPHGSISIGASAFASIALLPSAIKALRQRQPMVRVLVRDGLLPAAAVELRDGTLDLVICPLPAKRDQKEFRFEELLVSPLHVVARREHPLRGRALGLADLVGADWMVSGAFGGYGGTVERVFSEHGLPKPTILMRVDSIVAFQNILANSDLLGLLPRTLFESAASLNLEALEVRDRIRPVRIGAVTRADLPLSATAETFLSLVREEAARLR